MPYGKPGLFRVFGDPAGNLTNSAGPNSAGANAFGARDIFVGQTAGADVGDASLLRSVNDSVFLGNAAGQDCQASGVTIVGSQAGDAGLPFSVNGGFNGAVIIGRNAATNLTAWNTNTRRAPVIIGDNACAAMTGVTGVNGTQRLVVIGTRALENVVGMGAGGDGVGAVYIGHAVGRNYTNATGLGLDVLIGDRVAGDNAAAGSGIGGNVAIGALACGEMVGGFQNTIIGSNAARTLTNGDSNVIVGRDAGDAILTTDDNVIIGHTAASAAGQQPANCVIIGRTAGGGFGSGDFNTALGNQCASDSTLNDGNIVIGSFAATNNVPRADNALYIERGSDGLIFGELDTGNLTFGGAKTNRSFGNGTNVVKLQDGTAPSSDPTAGGFLYSTLGALSWRGSAGTITPLATA